MIVRSETAADIAAIRAITRAAFAGMPHSAQTEAAIVDALRTGGALTLSLVAELNGRVVGHAAFSPVTIDGAPSAWFGLGPVSVLPAHQRGGIGQRVIREGLKRLQTKSAGGCVVLGDPAYYRRFGFKPHPALRYRDVPPEYFQALAFIGDIPAGAVEYHPGFDAS